MKLKSHSFIPSQLDQLLITTAARSILEAIIVQRGEPRLLLVGPPGIGKFTCAKLVMQTLLPGFTETDLFVCMAGATSKAFKNVDLSSVLVGLSVHSTNEAGFRCAIIKHIDGLSAGDARSLVAALDNFAPDVPVFATTTKLEKVHELLINRLTAVDIAKPDEAQLRKRVVQVLNAQGLTLSDARIANAISAALKNPRKLFTSTLGVQLQAEQPLAICNAPLLRLT